MTIREVIEAGAQSAAPWIMVTTLGGVGYLVRRVFTNQKHIDALQASLNSRDRERKRDLEEMRGAFKRIEDAQKEMRDDIKNLFQR